MKRFTYKKELTVEDVLKTLQKFYDKMPETSGCLENINKENGCGGWCCLAEGTMIYTPCGLVSIEQLKPGDPVFTKNGLSRVVRTGSRKIAEDVCEITTCYGRKIKLTKDHRVFVDFITRKGRYIYDKSEFVEAGSLVSKNGKTLPGHYVIFPKIKIKENKNPIYIQVSNFANVFECKEGDNFSKDEIYCYASSQKRGHKIKDHVLLSQDFCWILGLYLAEGSTGDSSIDFHISSDEKDILNKIEKFAKFFDLYCSNKINRGKSKTVRVFSRVLSRFFKSVCGSGCENKKLDDKLFKLIVSNENLRMAFHSGLYAGDGTKKLSEKIKYSYTTTSIALSNQILFLNYLENEFPIFFHGKPKNRKECFTISISDGKFKDYVETDNDFRIPIRNIDIVKYKGNVYDIEVANGESFLTEAGEVHNCKYQSPQVLNIEFINTWDFVLNNFSNEEIFELLEKSIRNYLSNDFSKGCIFWNKETKLCKIHTARPFNCYLYGITPKEEFTERYDRMKREHKNEFGAVIRQQCDLVSTVNCDMPTVEETEKLWKELIDIEKNIGIDASLIHDGDGGTYRTYHDYILIKLLPESSLSDMTTLRLYGEIEEKEQFVCNFMSSFRKAYTKIEEKERNK